MSLLYISQQMTIYVGIFLFIIGVIGNGMNILIFSSTHSYRTNPSTFYFLFESIFKGLCLIVNLTPRIVSVGYGIDLTRTSLIWCKLRNVFITILSSTSVTFSCLATIDQYFVTSQHAFLRRCSKIQWAHRIVVIVIIVWLIHAIPVYLYYYISPITNTCVPSNLIFAVYIPIYVLIVICAIPVLIMMIFGCLTYRNIRRTRILAGQHADRQLTKMILMQVILVVICITPAGFLSTYGMITTNIVKDGDRQLKEYFVSTIFNLLTYFYYSGSFYLFLISSSRFRQTLKDRIYWWQQRNRIHVTLTLRSEHHR